MAVKFIRKRFLWRQLDEASIILMDPHQVDSHVIGNYDKVLSNYNADITVVQEMRWIGQGQTNLTSCDIYYSGFSARIRVWPCSER